MDPSSCLDGIPLHKYCTSIQYQSEFQSVMHADSENLVPVVGKTGALDDGVWRAESTTSDDAS